jgi:hypothetical protein
VLIFLIPFYIKKNSFPELLVLIYGFKRRISRKNASHSGIKVTTK